MADTTLNKRIAALAKKLGVSPLDLKNDLVGQMSVVKKEFGDGYEPTSNIDLANEIGKSLQARGPEYYKLFRDHYDAENPNKPFSRVIEPFNTILSEMADRGLESDAKEKYANPFGYEEDPNGEGFSVPSDRDEAFIEEFEEETGDAASPDRPKPTTPKTLEQPEGGMPTIPANQTQANLQAKINSTPEDVALGSGGATKKNRSRMNLQAEADRQAADIIKQQKKASDQNNFLRDRYDATGGRGVGAFDALSPDAKAQAIKNYRENSFFDSSTQAGRDQEELFAENNPNYTPPMADPISRAEARKMNGLTMDGLSTNEQNYGYDDNGDGKADVFTTKPRTSPETVQEGTMMQAKVAPDPTVNLETVSLPESVPGQYNPPERVYPAPDSATEGDRGGIDVSEIFKQNPALQMDGEGNMIPPADGPGNDVTKYSPPDVSNIPPIDDVFANLPEAPVKPEVPYSPPDVSKMPPIEDVFNGLPEAPERPQPQRAPTPAPIAKAPPPPPAQKPQGQSPVYGKKPDGTYGITGYRNLADMKTGAYTPTMANNERRADQQKRARSGEMSNPFADLGSTYNRYADGNEDAFAKRRAQQAELAKNAARQRELAKMPTPRADAGMDLMNSLPMNQQVGIVNQFRKKRGEQEIFNPYSV